jgi:cellobiose-specific phosphotransferase system component IIC
MLGLLLLYWVGKAFYDLAKQYGRGPWPYAILAIVCYYGLQFIVGGVAVLVMMDQDGYFNESDLEGFGLNILGVVIGALGTWVFYRLLKKKWSETTISKHTEILDDELTV